VAGTPCTDASFSGDQVWALSVFAGFELSLDTQAPSVARAAVNNAQRAARRSAGRVIILFSVGSSARPRTRRRSRRGL